MPFQKPNFIIPFIPILVMACLTILPILSESSERSIHQTQVRLLLDRCGILERLQQFPQQIFKQMGTEDTPSRSKKYAPEHEMIFQALDIRDMERELVANMVRYMDEQATARSLQWFESPIGIEITDLEQTTYTPHAWEERQTFVQAMGTNPPSPHRVRLIRQLTESTYLSKIDEDLELTTALALTGAMNATLPPEEHIDFEQIRQKLQAQRDEMKQGLQEERVVNFLYLYHKLQDEEIEQYLRYLHSESGKQFNAGLLLSLKAVFRAAGERIGTAFGRAVKGERQI